MSVRVLCGRMWVWLRSACGLAVEAGTAVSSPEAYMPINPSYGVGNTTIKVGSYGIEI